MLNHVCWVLQPAEWMMSGTLGALAVVAAAVVRIYLGWAYVGNRLLSAAVEYEETGWSAFVPTLHASFYAGQGKVPYHPLVETGQTGQTRSVGVAQSPSTVKPG